MASTLHAVSGELFRVTQGEDLHDWIHARRDEGMSWRTIERTLRELTDGHIDVTHQTIRSWVDDAAVQVPA